MMRRVLVLVTAGLVLVTAGPAWAHEEINPKTVRTGNPTFLTLDAANEKKVDLTKVTLNAPQGLPFGATTREPAGWTVTKSEEQLIWTGGAVKSDNFDSWGFEIEGADQPGTLRYKVTLGFADGSSDNVDVNIKAQGAAVVAPVKASNGRANLGIGLGIGALGLSLVALALAIAARSRRGPGSAAAAPPAAGAGPGERQDW